MKFFSLRWKLSIALGGLSFGLLSLYVLIAKDTFESDKISYAFESEQSRINSIAKSFDQELKTLLFLANSTLSTYDFRAKALNPVGQSLFRTEPALLAVELWDQEKSESLIKAEKAPSKLFAPDKGEVSPQPGQVSITSLGSNRILILTSQKGTAGDSLRVRVLVEFPEIFHEDSTTSFFLGDKEKILSSKSKDLGPTDVQELNGDLARARGEQTLVRRIGNEDYLVSSAKSRFGDLQFFSLAPKEAALGGLKILFRRSLVFLIFSAFITIILSLLLSRGLTLSLGLITLAAAKIGKGDFSGTEVLKSRDEVGVLSLAFQKMNTEIQRLLNETKDKVRMEEELKTASLVQESLLPKNSAFTKNGISLSGFYMTSTECGGDWWHYFEKGDALYIAIADATGHGTPSALITAAARATFSLIEKMDLSLSEMMTAWDQAVLSCSDRKVFMTAILMRINTRTGLATFLNASHEWPIHYIAASNGSMVDAELVSETGPTLGEGETVLWSEQQFQLKPGDKILLYTDGLLAVVNPEAKVLNERKVRRLITSETEVDTRVAVISAKIQNLVEAHRNGTPLPDDVMTVVIGRAA